MSRYLSCPHGHLWEHANAVAPDGSTLAVCPQCGSAGTLTGRPADPSADHWKTVYDSPRSGEAIELPETAPPSDATSDPHRPAAIPATIPSVVSDPDAATGTIIAGFELVSICGRGAMGVVYKARQLALNRLVALKMVLAGGYASPQERARFLAEAEAVASLQHPNIVQVYDVGSHQGLPFFSMEIVDGGTLERKSQGGAPIAPREAARLVEKLARAMHFAHQNGIIHRDLKPANVLLTAEGEPKITDFGLAKRFRDDPEATTAYATLAGAPVGTPSYMAPEQAAGQSKLVGPLADVYSLGAILYDLLTGTPPFLGDSVLDTLAQVRTAEPRSPLLIKPGLPRDLVTICLKCLAKDPMKRYGSAGELADELQRFLKGVPIRAVPAGPVERTVKWARRRPAAAALVAVSALAAMLLVGGSIAYNVKLARAIAETSVERRAAVQRLVRLNVQTGMDLIDDSHVPEALPLLVEALRLTSELNEQTEGPLDPVASDDEIRHRIRLTLALRECPKLVRLWVHEGPIFDAAFSPDGRRVITAGAQRDAVMWDVNAGEAISPKLHHDGSVHQVSFSADGARVLTASADGLARIWNVADGRELCRSPKHGGEVVGAEFSRDGRRFCTASVDGTARIFDAATARELVPALKHPGGVWHATFSPDGRYVLTVAGDAARLWDAETGKNVGPPLRHDGPVLNASFSPDGQRLVTAGQDRRARVWNLTARGAEPGPSLMHQQAVVYAIFSPDGKRVATASEDGSAQLWFADSGKPASQPLRHRERVNQVAFAPDGRYVATASSDNTVLVWHDASGVPFTHELLAGGNVVRVLFSPDGRHILSASDSGIVRLWVPVHAFVQPHPRRGFMAYTPTRENPMVVKSDDGAREAVSFDGFTVQVRDAKTAASIGPVLAPGGMITSATFDPAGARLLLTTAHGQGKIWDVATGKLLVSVAHASPILCGNFSPDGRLIATGSSDNRGAVWDAWTGEPRTRLMNHEGSIYRVEFSPDSHCLVTDSENGIARMWCAVTGERLSPPLDPDGWVKQAFTTPSDPRAWRLAPDGRSIEEFRREAEWLSGSYVDKLGRLVPVTRRQLAELTKLMGHQPLDSVAAPP